MIEYLLNKAKRERHYQEMYNEIVNLLSGKNVVLKCNIVDYTSGRKVIAEKGKTYYMDKVKMRKSGERIYFSFELNGEQIELTEDYLSDYQFCEKIKAEYIPQWPPTKKLFTTWPRSFQRRQRLWMVRQLTPQRSRRIGLLRGIWQQPRLAHQCIERMRLRHSTGWSFCIRTILICKT